MGSIGGCAIRRGGVRPGSTAVLLKVKVALAIQVGLAGWAGFSYPSRETPSRAATALQGVFRDPDSNALCAFNVFYVVLYEEVYA